MAKQNEEEILDISESINKTEEYIERNKKVLSGIGIVVLLAIVGYFGYKQFVVNPQEENARKVMFMAERYFEQDSLSRALNGDGNFPGFLDIISDYGASKSGNLAKFYAGVCYLKMGEYDNAIEYLKKYKPKDEITGAIAYGNIGDVYAEQDDLGEAITYYKKAIKFNDNQFSAPLYMMKLGTIYEVQQNYADAVEIYKEIKQKYPTSTEGRNVERHLSRAMALAK